MFKSKLKDIKDIDVVILCGGLGTRLKSILPDKPKILVSFGKRVLLEIILEGLEKQGFKKAILCTGYLSEKIKNWIKKYYKGSLMIDFSEEREFQGTAMALKKATDKIKSDPFFVINGDELYDINYGKMFDHHLRDKPIATLAVHSNDHPHDCDLIITDENNRILQLLPKKDRPADSDYPNLVHAGIRICSRKVLSILNSWEKTPADLEKDVLAQAIVNGQPISAYRTSEYIKDIGTPERYYEACQHHRDGLVALKSLNRPQKAIFLDRDGTINVYRKDSFISSPDQLQLIPGVSSAIARINESSYLAICVTNQAGIARGLCTEETLQKIHNRMETLLGHESAYLDRIYFCPHHPENDFPGERKEYKIKCNCRKPAPGMILQAQKEYNIDLSQSWMIGDDARDIQLGQNVGVKTILIKTGANQSMSGLTSTPDYVFDDLNQAVNFILCQMNNSLN